MNVHFTTKTLTIAALAATLVACGGSTPKAGSPTANPSAPEWVHKGSRVKDGKVYGLGMAGGIRNTELARTTAANRGRAEISKILEVYSASLMKDYQASTSAGGASSEEQRVEQAIKTFSANLMSGTTPIEYWLDAPKNTWFVLVELDFEKAKALANAKSSGDTKNWIDNNGRNVHDDLEGGLLSSDTLHADERGLLHLGVHTESELHRPVAAARRQTVLAY